MYTKDIELASIKRGKLGNSWDKWSTSYINYKWWIFHQAMFHYWKLLMLCVSYPAIPTIPVGVALHDNHPGNERYLTERLCCTVLLLNSRTAPTEVAKDLPGDTLKNTETSKLTKYVCREQIVHLLLKYLFWMQQPVPLSPRHCTCKRI